MYVWMCVFKHMCIFHTQKCISGLTEPKQHTTDGVGTITRGIQAKQQMARSIRSGPVSNTFERKVEEVHLPFPTTTGIRHQRPALGSESIQPIYIFPPVNLLPAILPLLQNYHNHRVLIAPWRPTAAILSKSQKHLHLRRCVSQQVQGVHKFSDFHSFEHWTAYSFWNTAGAVSLTAWQQITSRHLTETPPQHNTNHPGNNSSHSFPHQSKCSAQDTYSDSSSGSKQENTSLLERYSPTELH